MLRSRSSIRGAALAFTLGSAIVVPAALPVPANAAEASKNVPASYGELMKMKPMEAMHLMDEGNKGYVTREEFMKFQEALFQKMDQNKDEKISREEWIRQIHTAP